MRIRQSSKIPVFFKQNRQKLTEMEEKTEKKKKKPEGADEPMYLRRYE